MVSTQTTLDFGGKLVCDSRLAAPSPSGRARHRPGKAQRVLTVQNHCGGNQRHEHTHSTPKLGQWQPAIWDSAREWLRTQLHLELGEEDHYWLCLRQTLDLPHGLIKGVCSKVVYTYTKTQSGECRSHSTLRVWARNWATVIIAAQNEPTSKQNHHKVKMDPKPHCFQKHGGSAKPARHIQQQPVSGALFPFFPFPFFFFNSRVTQYPGAGRK